MTHTTQLYGQLFGFLRQYCRVRDLRHLKALAWMVSALICSGQLSLPAWEPYVPSRATKAQSVERRWRRWLRLSTSAGEPDVCAIGNRRVKRMERSSSIPGSRHHRLVGSLLHDSPVRHLLWSCSAVVVARFRAWQCHRRVSGVSTDLAKSSVVAALLMRM